MKKNIALLLFICIYSYSSIAQTTLCNDSLIMSIKGTWKLYPRQPMLQPVTKSEFDKATKNMEAFHQLLLEAYPQGIGCEPQVNMINPQPAFYTRWVYSYYYYTAIFYYSCIKNKPVKAVETNTTFRVYVNTYDMFWTSTNLFINGHEIFYRQPKAGKWKGQDVYYSKEEPLVILSRSDMLPYKPVTRKQYLDHMIHYFDSTYTRSENLYKNHDDPSIKEQATKITSKKNEILKVYRKELEKSEAKNLLDSAAIVKDIVNTSFFESTDIFIPEEKGGKVLLMVNPAYFRKDLPKYIPQFMIARIQGGESGRISERHFAKMIKENFPIEKLQAMIDK